MWERFEITTRPVDKRENYIKRGVGMPGDILELKDAQLYVNGKMSDNPENLQYRYEVRTNGTPLNRMKLQDIGLSLEDIGIPSTVNYFPLTLEMVEKLKKFPNVVEINRTKEVSPNPVSLHNPFCMCL